MTPAKNYKLKKHDNLSFNYFNIKEIIIFSFRNNSKSNKTIFSLTTTRRFTDLGKLKLHMMFGFRLKPTFTSAPAASKNDPHFKSGQNWLENTHLTL